ncbi:ribosome biogenesis protein ytm1 [Malassezia japonica]|uniref:Ribosome biogenesis protein YTM1 n=1 Tax=Malassezia japonica TaxID=223818 RepID=A0AAF0F7U2_9BASI|nr:ribosome biogenesis protein ytm1 [Malassezia japonica]WFD40028.1 ribosome biogenesis protein ytm1 [Malassezia japonica]
MQAPGDAAATLPIRLRTSLPGCSIPYVPYMVPVNWRRSQLSTLVNKVLQTADAERATVPFDFIVDGELLRCSLEEYLAQNARSTEEALELEYIRSTLPPAFKDAATQDDWVAGIDARSSTVLVASYDGNVRLFDKQNLEKEPVTYAPAYASGTTSLTTAQWLAQDETVVTGAMDGTVAVWRLPGSDAQTYQVLRAAELRHHTGPVTNVDVAQDGNPTATVLSAGWDGSIALWDVPRDASFASAADEEATSKKRRTKGGSARAAAETIEAPPPTVVFSHVAATLGASAAKVLGTAPAPGNNARTFARLGEQSVWSAAWDGSVKHWDLSLGGLAGEKASDKVPLCLDVMHGAAARVQVVTGHMDHSMALYDFRDTTHNAIAIANAHTAPVSAVRSHPTSSYLLASGAYDGRIKVWDVRSPKQALFALSQPLATSQEAKKGQTKLLSVDWTADGNSVVAGGEDCRVSIYQGNAIGDEHI